MTPTVVRNVMSTGVERHVSWRCLHTYLYGYMRDTAASNEVFTGLHLQDVPMRFVGGT